ncbi:hypothetical protein D3C87_891880 [compost metagenome]
MTTKFTPGPWFTQRSGFSTVYVEARIEGGMLQEVAACGPTEAGQDQQEANARLIAAAPELLEALEIMIVGACAVGVPHAGERKVLQDAVDHARAVINKASGEQQ